jgi:4-hydroxythreonine-4-phosphate dehydrogenase
VFHVKHASPAQPSLFHVKQIAPPGDNPVNFALYFNSIPGRARNQKTILNQPARPPPIALTMGDPSGIGPELCIKAVAHLQRQGESTPLRLFGDLAHLLEINALLGRPLDPRAVSEMTEDIGNLGPYPIGKVAANSGRAAYQSVKSAAQACLSGEVAAMVTAPLNKEAMRLAGHAWPGHTELLAHLSQPEAPPPVRMLLVNHELKVLLHTIHIPLSRVASQITGPSLLETIQIAHHQGGRYGCPNPRIAVAGLNPHASEGGVIGREDIDVIAPCIESARALGIQVSGPWPADTVFMRARQNPNEIQLVIALYHDQGLIPIKYLGVDHGVNITLGLPFVRTSVDHGTAFDIAQTWKASPDSLLAAIHEAEKMASYAQANPLTD